MCSVYEENQLSPPEKRVSECDSRKLCMKCDQQAVVIIRVNDAMCRSCFIEYATHKFRSAFGKSKVIRDQERVLVGFSGGAGSSAMVHLIQEGLSKRAMKKLRFIPTLIYIDEGAVLSQTAEERHLNTTKVVGLMRETNVPYYVYTLEQALSVPTEGQDALDTSKGLASLVDNTDDEALVSLIGRMKLSEGDSEELARVLKNAKTLTAKTRFIDILRLRLLSAIAKQHGVNKVLMGDSGSRLSVRLLSGIAQGQGAHLPFEIGFADRRDKNTTYIRPLREFTAKEVSVYNELNGVPTVFIPNIATKSSAHSSIYQLTEGFVSGLQAEYPNTVSTIFRTGEKFDLNETEQTSDKSCVMCKCPLDTDVGPSSALSATQFSQSLCSQMAASKKSTVSGSSSCCEAGGSGGGCSAEGTPSPNTSCCGEGDGSCSRQTNRLSAESLEACLCYGCRLLTKDLVSVDSLPADIKWEVSRITRRRQMKQEIGEFLLDDEDDNR